MQEPEDLCPPFVARNLEWQSAHERHLVYALRGIEWGGPFVGGDPHCPTCGGAKANGHAEGCPVGLALAPDHGAGALRGAVADGLRIVDVRRQAINSLVSDYHRELDDLHESLTWIQDFLHKL